MRLLLSQSCKSATWALCVSDGVWIIAHPAYDGRPAVTMVVLAGGSRLTSCCLSPSRNIVRRPTWQADRQKSCVCYKREGSLEGRIRQGRGATPHTKRSEWRTAGRTSYVTRTLEPVHPHLSEAHKERSLDYAAILPCSASCLSWYVTQTPDVEIALHSLPPGSSVTQQTMLPSTLDRAEKRTANHHIRLVCVAKTLRIRVGGEF